MAETAPRYPSRPTIQAPIFENGTHQGYRVALTLQSGALIHEEAVDVIIGPEAAAALAAAPLPEFTAWVQAQMAAHDLVARANAALAAKLAAQSG
jgi:hypothetical protein